MYAVLTTKKARWPRRLLAAREPTPKKNAEEDANGRSCRPQRRTLQEPARRRDRVSCCGLRATPAIALLDVSLECGASRRQRERPAKRTAHLGPTSLRLCGIICQTTIAKYLAKTEEKLTVLAQSGRLPPAPAHTHHHHQPHTHTKKRGRNTHAPPPPRRPPPPPPRAFLPNAAAQRKGSSARACSAISVFSLSQYSKIQTTGKPSVQGQRAPTKKAREAKARKRTLSQTCYGHDIAS